MELAILNEKYQRSKIIEDWSSLIWSERYSTNGDFEMHSDNIAGMIKALPLGGPYDPPCLVGLRDSTVPMVVESHRFGRKKNGSPEIITTGRSFETVLDRRQMLRTISSAAGRQPWVINAASPSDAAWIAIDKVVINPEATPLDKMPEVVFQDTDSQLWPEGSTSPVMRDYPVEVKDLYSWIIDTLKLSQNGLKAIRPGVDGDKIGITIYKGADRSKSVVFSVATDQLDSTDHLLSTLGYKNVMVTGGTNGIANANTGQEPSGLARRVGWQDAASDTDKIPAGPDLQNLLINKSKIGLADAHQTTLFSGEIAGQLAAQYGVDFFLGDIVKLAGEYGLTDNVRISEYVRSQDATGIKAYPTFEAVTP
jgi:hypothetical protein